MSTTEGGPVPAAPFDQEADMPGLTPFDPEIHGQTEPLAAIPAEFQDQYGPEHAQAAFQALASQERRRERRDRGWRVVAGAAVIGAVGLVNGLAVHRVATGDETRVETGVTADGHRFNESFADYVVLEVGQRTVDTDPAQPLVNEATQIMHTVPNRGRWALGAAALDIAGLGAIVTFARRRRTQQADQQ